ncbi:hypothetical protein SAMN05720766_1084 [Fibrobacter sp. UWH9]|uniref:hypothetical protein n=1 Tax=unclassified Fibrobacter TaxID=2634177 RepID=UPI0009218067|nr:MULTISPECIES: hypothetical protein [Fibrobacter]MCQ2099786.1 hypothetical protein [Fibrobacter sp.]MCL4102007.1 hypothetical protein [Fibrobacter succinogenes]MDO4946513.1 hypothetical protein [Fibrobacter sp.]SHH15827.1 hypothetical protein SAMN05720766_1084 [Fibrobacter sp. UWH9]SHL48352.1 hypothetical protein SAMN05720765_11587 [Fibrobacter sp. UWH6]
MEFINNMELACGLFKNSHIQVKKAFFGLKKNVIYTLTNSIVRGSYMEYDFTNGKKVAMLLETPWESLEAVLGKVGRPVPADNGMFCLSMCYSQDRKFAAMQLCRYVSFDYVPTCDIRFAEGDEAEILLRPFVK